MHRNTPNSTGISPAECLFKVRPRTRFDLLNPCFNRNTELKSDIIHRVKLYKVNDNVYVKNVMTKLWQRGKIVRIMSPATYLVQVGPNVKLIHSNDLRLDSQVTPEISVSECVIPAHPIVSIPTSTNETYVVNSTVTKSEVSGEPAQAIQASDKNNICSAEKQTIQPKTIPLPKDCNAGTPVAYKTKSGRTIKPPVKLDW